jgi:hypothetical protein
VNAFVEERAALGKAINSDKKPRRHPTSLARYISHRGEMSFSNWAIHRVQTTIRFVEPMSI